MHRTGFKTLLGALCIFAMTSCHHSGHNHDEHDHEHAEGHVHGEEADLHDEEEGEHHHADAIVLSPEKAAAAGVVADTVRLAEFSGVVPVSGRVLPASGDETTVSATIAGIVKLARPITDGASVGRGTPLFAISTASLPDGDVTQRASVAYQAAKTEYERAQKLIEDHLISQKEFTAAKAEYDKARLAYNAVANAGRGGVTISAPVSGYVKDLMVKDGDFVEIGQPLMTLTQNRNMYLRAEVAEKDYRIISNVVSAKFRTAYSDSVYDLRDHNGRILSFGKSTDNTSSFIPVTFEFDNCSGVIPGSFAEIYLVTSEKSNVISIPVTALTEEQGVYFVYVKEDDDCYRKQEVKLGATDGQSTEITAGLTPGEVVVTKGAIHVKLASAGKSIPGHTHNH